MTAALKRCGRNVAFAEDACSDAFKAVLEGAKTGRGRLWNPKTHPDLELYMIGVVLSAVSSKRKADRRYAPLKPRMEEAIVSPLASPERMLRESAGVERARRIVAAARAKLNKDGQEMIDQLAAKTYDPIEFQRSRHISVADEKACRERVRYQVNAATQAEPEPAPNSSPGLMPAAAIVTSHREDEP
jgi:hypothetical protein